MSEKSETGQVDAEEALMKRVFRDFNISVSQHKLWVALYCFVVVAATAAVVFSQTSYYRAEATLLIDPNLVQDPAEQKSLANLDLQVAVIRSPELADKVIGKANLLTDPEFAESPDPRQHFSENLETAVEKTNNTIQIYYLNEDPEKAALIANEIAETFLNFKSTKSSGLSVESIDSLQQQVKQQMDKLSVIKTKIAELNKANPDLGGESVVGDQIKYLNNEYIKTDARILQLKTTIAELESLIQNGGSVENNPYAASHPRVRTKLDRLREAELEVVQLEQEYRGMHPAVLKAQTKRNALQQTLDEEKTQLLTELRAEQKTSEATLEQLRQNIQKLQTQEKELTPQKLEYKNLLAEETSVSETVKLLNSQISKASVAASYKQTGIEILSYASVPQSPFKPDRPKAILLAFVFAVFSSLGFIFLRCYMDKSFRLDEDIEELLMKPFLGHLPSIRSQKDGVTPVFRDEKESVFFYNYLRLACANMNFLNTEQGGKQSIMVTSSRPGEGKTFVAYHLAHAYAREGRVTVLIDTDFCRSSLSYSFPQPEVKRPGLHDYLMENAKLEQIIEETTQKNLYLIRSQEAEFSAPHALRSERMKDLLRDLKNYVDVIVLDAPPTLTVSDAVALGEIVDMRVFVIEWGKTPREVVQRAISRVAPGNLVPACVILNKVKNIGGSYYSQYHHYYSGKSEKKKIDADEKK